MSKTKIVNAICLIWIATGSIQAGWDGFSNLTNSSKQNDLFPDIAVDNLKWSTPQRFGRPHIVWTSYVGNEYRTFYKVKSENISSGWSGTLVLDTEDSVMYASDWPTNPTVCVSNNEDLPEIAFVQTRPGWYYCGIMPRDAVFIREVLFNWQPVAIFSPLDLIDPPDHLHHVSGLQRGVKDCMMTSLNFQPAWGYRNAIFWSQIDNENQAGNDDPVICFNGQRTAKLTALTHIDWVEQTGIFYDDEGTRVKLPGETPYAASTYNKQKNPFEAVPKEAYYLAAVSRSTDENKLKLAVSRKDSLAASMPFEWEIMDIPGTSGSILPSCAFKVDPSDPWGNEPELHIVYLSGYPNFPVYYLRTAVYDPQQTQWIFSPSAVLIAYGSTSYPARPEIVFAENGDRWIAFISSDNEVKVKKNSDNAVYASVTTDNIQHSWVSIAVDSVSLQGGYLPQIACTGKSASQTNWDIYYAKCSN